MTKPTNETSLTQATAELLRNRPTPLTLKQIATDCGVSADWLSLLLNGHLPNAAADKVQRVYERLTGRPLLGD